MRERTRWLLGGLGAVWLTAVAPLAAWAQEAAPAAPAAAEAGEQGMTLVQLIQAGGVVMIVIGALAVLATALVLFFALTLRMKRVVNSEFIGKAYTCLFQGDLEGAVGLCTRDGGLVAKVLLAGIEVDAADREGVQEAMQAEGSRLASSLWQRVTYLQDIAVLAPMLGILGTVLGMIRAFNAIAMATSLVKPVALAAGVSQALVTTAAGLTVAIPSMAFYFLFRGRVQRIVAATENASAQFLEKLAAAKRDA